MNKKQLIIAAMAAFMSVSAVNAESYITGITNGGNGPFDIKPGTVSGDVGYRYYDQFNLGAGDIANLIFSGEKNGTPRDINSFINLVQQGIKIDGIVNTMRNNNFYNGHAIFVSPNGMTVGASGVLNVGQLSVVTPTGDKFKELHDAYDARTEAGYRTMNDISGLRAVGANAPVKIEGTVLSRNGIDIRGSLVDVASTGKMMNGLSNSEVISSKTRADALFNSLVNTTGLENGSMVIVKSGTGANAGIKIAGKVQNLATGQGFQNPAKGVGVQNAETAITNNGGQGMNITGEIFSNKQVVVYNKNGDLLVNGSAKITNKSGDVSVSNAGRNLSISNTAQISANNNLGIVNKGTGNLAVGTGTALTAKRIDAVNKGSGAFTVDNNANIGNASTDTVRIVNRGGKLTFAGNANGNSVSVRNQGSEMELTGDINAGQGILVHNEKGAANVGGSLTVANGDIAVYNEGTGKLTTSANITNNGNTAIKNESTGGMEFNGTITTADEAYNEIAITNTAGDMTVNGTITNNNGNLGIINKENGTGMTVAANITNEGKMNIKNYSGANGMTLTGNIQNTGDTLNVYNDKGMLIIDGLLTVNDGNMNIGSRTGSTGIKTTAGSNITANTGNVAITNKGTNGMDLNGTVSANNGVLAINNHAGNMSIKGSVTGNRNIGIINRATGADMTVDATINAKGNNTVNIKNFGTGDMSVNGDITHEGRLNILANEGLLNMDGQIHNNGTDMTYAASRVQKTNPTPGTTGGKGIVVGENFKADSQDGDILITNISGNQGLTYEGQMNSKNGQAEIYNLKGDMNVNAGSIDAKTAIVLNKGNKLTVTDAVTLSGENKVKIVNKIKKGTESADVADKFKNSGEFREKVQE